MKNGSIDEVKRFHMLTPYWEKEGNFLGYGQTMEQQQQQQQPFYVPLIQDNPGEPVSETIRHINHRGEVKGKSGACRQTG